MSGFRKNCVFMLLTTLVMGGLFPSFAQEGTKPFMQKAEDDYAVYTLGGTYSESGYLGARIDMKREGQTRIFRVTPGWKYRLKEIRILGVSGVPVKDLLKGAPVADEVYSGARMSEWSGSIWKKYGPPRGPFTHVSQTGVIDNENATVTVKVEFQEKR